MSRITFMKRPFRYIVVMAMLALGCCMKQEWADGAGFDWSAYPAGDGVFVVNEGNFMYGNASLSYYIPSEKKIIQEVFCKANGEKLGDVAQSMTIYNGRGYVVVNNSGIIFIVDIDTGEVIGSVEGLLSPRYIHFLGDTKAYVTDLYATSITIFNPKTGFVLGEIDTEGHKSTEQLVQWGDLVFVNCWSYDNKILVIDTSSDRLVGEIEVGVQPTSMALDKNGKLWTVTDGGFDGNPFGWEAPALYRIDAATRTIEKRFVFAKEESPSEICTDATGENIFFINGGVWKMDVTAATLPERPLIEYRGTKYHGLAVSPSNGDIYLADAIDYVQAGVIYRYDAAGSLIDSFRTGITPGAFCFRR